MASLPRALMFALYIIRALIGENIVIEIWGAREQGYCFFHVNAINDNSQFEIIRLKQ